MTQTELNAAVDNYFTVHLDKEYWFALDADKRAATVAMAFSDIAALIPGLTLNNLTADSAAVKAVAEQAVFLNRNYETIAEGKVVTSEGAEGISVGYTLVGTSFQISPRAETFIKHAKRLYFGGFTRISRG